MHAGWSMRSSSEMTLSVPGKVGMSEAGSCSGLFSTSGSCSGTSPRSRMSRTVSPSPIMGSLSVTSCNALAALCGKKNKHNCQMQIKVFNNRGQTEYSYICECLTKLANKLQQYIPHTDWWDIVNIRKLWSHFVCQFNSIKDNKNIHFNTQTCIHNKMMWWCVPLTHCSEGCLPVAHPQAESRPQALLNWY